MEQLSLEAVEARDAFSRGKSLMRTEHGGLSLELLLHKAAMWLIFRRDKRGGVALRTPLLAEGTVCTLAKPDGDEVLAWQGRNELGDFRAELRGEETGLEQFSYTVTFTAHHDLHIPYVPRDLVVFGRNGDPLASEGAIEARQRKLNTGLCYLNITKPAIGKVLYVQNLTALNPYFRVTETVPENAVGGEWPIMGYLPPTHPADPAKRLPAGKAVVLYDTRLVGTSLRAAKVRMRGSFWICLAQSIGAWACPRPSAATGLAAPG